MNKIEMGKKYRTRGGKDARVLCIDSGNTKYPVIAVIANAGDPPDVVILTATGCYWFGTDKESTLDLIEVSPYEHLKIDDPVVVWDNFTQRVTKLRRHFAGVDGQGRALAWINGLTSHTSGIPPTVWDNCVAYDKEIHATVTKGI